MTYIQITTRCNMSCEHCGMRCGKKGDDMSKAVWKKAVEFAARYDSHISIGGGEPTMHKHFREFLLDAIGECEDSPMFIATNGSIKKHALLLAKLAKAGVIHAALSQDIWHDPISDEVVNAFTVGNGGSDDLREIRNVEKNVSAAGRAIDNDLSEDHRCICSGWFFIDPLGNLKACGCEDSPIICNIMETPWESIDTILEDLQDDDNSLGTECWKDCKKLTEKVDLVA